MARTRTAPLPSHSGWASTAEEWSQARFHNAYFPSGQKCIITFPSLGPVALADALPEDYADFLRAEITHKLGSAGYFGEEIVRIGSDKEIPDENREAEQAELVARYGRMLRWLVAEHVLVDPKVTPEDLTSERFALDDINWLYAIATRRTDRDGLGRRLGVASLEVCATFREAHGEERCAPDCPGCLATLDALSTADLGPL